MPTSLRTDHAQPQAGNGRRVDQAEAIVDPLSDVHLRRQLAAFCDRCDEPHTCGSITQPDVDRAQELLQEAGRRIDRRAATFWGRLRDHSAECEALAVAAMTATTLSAVQYTDLMYGGGDPLLTGMFACLTATLAVASVVLLLARWRTGAACEAIEQLQSAGDAVRDRLCLLADLPGLCDRALALVRVSADAAALRDQVLARGEPLRRFHLRAFGELMQEGPSKRAHEAACRTLHGVPAAAAVRPA